MTRSTWRRATASILVLALTSFVATAPALADPGAVFSGKVVGAEPPAPRAGVVVTLVEPDSEQAYRSAPTAADGTFRVEGVPAGSYRVLAETDEGAYLAADSMQLNPGDNRPVSLTLTGAAPNYQSGAGTGGQQQASGLPTWAKWVIVGGIVVLAVVAIDKVTADDAEIPASLD